uniref:Uncharacterized protein n=1 Tax=Crocodylus porosus TaxID=8502 RepID=A0A7M4G0F0_CROPO
SSKCFIIFSQLLTHSDLTLSSVFGSGYSHQKNRIMHKFLIESQENRLAFLNFSCLKDQMNPTADLMHKAETQKHMHVKMSYFGST